MRTSGRTALQTKPNLHRAGLGGRKQTYKKRSQKARALSPPRMRALVRSFSLSPPRAGALFSSRLWLTCPFTSKMDFPAIIQIKSSWNTSLSKSCNTVHSRPESCVTDVTAEGVFTVVTPGLRCDETKTEAHTLA